METDAALGCQRDEPSVQTFTQKCQSQAEMFCEMFFRISFFGNNHYHKNILTTILSYSIQKPVCELFLPVPLYQELYWCL